MSKQETRRQIDWVDSMLPDSIGDHGAAWYRDLCQARLALIQTLEVQKRMAPDTDNFCACATGSPCNDCPDWDSNVGRCLMEPTSHPCPEFGEYLQATNRVQYP